MQKVSNTEVSICTRRLVYYIRSISRGL